MKKPYIVAIDDDVSVLHAVEPDLKARFSQKYRILAADSAQRGIGIVRQLTAYADSKAAIDAINKVKLNHYLMKPWEPPEHHLCRVLSDQLENWQAGHQESFEAASSLRQAGILLGKDAVIFHRSYPGVRFSGSGGKAV